MDIGLNGVLVLLIVWLLFVIYQISRRLVLYKKLSNESLELSQRLLRTNASLMLQLRDNVKSGDLKNDNKAS
jgi:hypothetical protein